MIIRIIKDLVRVRDVQGLSTLGGVRGCYGLNFPIFPRGVRGVNFL